MRISERGKNTSFGKTGTAFWFLKRDRRWQFIIAIFVAAIVLLSLTEYDIQPYFTKMNYSAEMYNYRLVKGVNEPVEKLDIQALAPELPINITIPDPQNLLLEYHLYFINDTGLAIGLGPSTLIQSGNITGRTTLSVKNVIDNMTYRLVLHSPTNQTYDFYVSVSQYEEQFPPANYLTLIPGVILLVGGLIASSYMLSVISRDRALYYSSLGYKGPEGAYPSKKHGLAYRLEQSRFGKYMGMIIGVILCAVGLELLGRIYYLTWVSIVLILLGIAFFLGGLIRLTSRY